MEKWVGHVERCHDNRWTRDLQYDIHNVAKKKGGRQNRRWQDDLMVYT